MHPFRNNDGIADCKCKTTQKKFRTEDNVSVATMADGGTGTNVSTRLGLYRSQPCDNGTSVGRQPQLNAFTGRVNSDAKVIPRTHQQTRSAGSDRRPMCSPSEYFCLKTSHNDAMLDNRSASAAATAVNGYCLNDSKAAAMTVDDWHSYRNPADGIAESNLQTCGTSRRSGIPVSSMLLLFMIGNLYLC